MVGTNPIDSSPAANLSALHALTWATVVKMGNVTSSFLLVELEEMNRRIIGEGKQVDERELIELRPVCRRSWLIVSSLFNFKRFPKKMSKCSFFGSTRYGARAHGKERCSEGIQLHMIMSKLNVELTKQKQIRKTGQREKALRVNRHSQNNIYRYRMKKERWLE